MHIKTVPYKLTFINLNLFKMNIPFFIHNENPRFVKNNANNSLAKTKTYIEFYNEYQAMIKIS